MVRTLQGTFQPKRLLAYSGDCKGWIYTLDTIIWQPFREKCTKIDRFCLGGCIVTNTIGLATLSISYAVHTHTHMPVQWYGVRLRPLLTLPDKYGWPVPIPVEITTSLETLLMLRVLGRSNFSPRGCVNPSSCLPMTDKQPLREKYAFHSTVLI